MLVLSRRPGEAIRIGKDIEIVVTAVRGKHVHIGIQAPDTTRIRRSEIPPQGRSEGKDEE
jgi:carbon storage regulator